MEPKKSSSGGEAMTANNPFFNKRDNSSVRAARRDSFSMRRRSRSSLDSEYRSRASISCVTRQMSGEDCARQKFIVWAAVKRNRSVRMAPSERLRCPLLRCGEQFDNHEMMLRHLTDCRHLAASGEYVCYECMKVEKFNDGKCKCCLGHPTKRRRMINLAKNFFSTLGHKSRKEGGLYIDQDDFPMPPPSYDSLDIEEEGQSQPQSQGSVEMGGNEIVELDAGPLPPAELDAINYQTEPMDCLPSHPNSAGPSSFFPETPDFFMLPADGSYTFQVEAAPSPTSSRPSLALDTHNIGPPKKVPRTKYLSPSSSLRSNNSSQGISPMSAGSASWAMASSIDTTLTSPITPFSPTGVDSITLSRENSCKFPKDYPLSQPIGSQWFEQDNRDGMMPKSSDATEATDNYVLDGISELPGDDPQTIPRQWDSDPFSFSFNNKDNYSWSTSIDTEVNVLFTSDGLTGPEVPTQSQREPAGTETKTLVGSTWDTLREHISSSLQKVAHLKGNVLAHRLRSHTAKDIAATGLASLRSILNGRNPTNPYEYLCFIHVVYAFSLIIHEDDLANRCNKLFRQALAYRGFLPTRGNEAYSEVVAAIWQPLPSDDAEQNGSSLGRSSSLKGKDPEIRMNPNASIKLDPLVAVAQNFLDDLEYSAVGGESQRSIEVLTSDLYSTHLSDLRLNPGLNNAFMITVGYITKSLSQQFSEVGDQSLSPRFKAINDRVNGGYIMSIRKLELELLQAGKNCMPSIDLFDDFIPKVRQLCDPLYPTGCNPRTKYHTLGVTLVESLFQNAGNGPQEAALPDFSTGALGTPDLFGEFLEPLDSNFDVEINGQDIPDFMMPMDLEMPLGSSLDLSSMQFTVDLPEKVPSSSAVDKTDLPPKPTINPTNLSRVGSQTQISKDDGSCVPHEPLPDSSTESPEYSRTENEDCQSDAGTSSNNPQAEAHSICEICGYRPKGDPQWFKGSMAKHKKLQHLSEPKIYRCSFPGCTSAYKNRPDNLRQHQIEKSHFVDGVDDRGRRPNKRKKVAE